MLWYDGGMPDTSVNVTQGFFLSFTLSFVYVLALWTTGEGSSYGDSEATAKRPLTEEEKLEQVKRSEYTLHRHYPFTAVCDH